MVHPCALLDESQVKTIKARLWKGDYQEDIAVEYDVDPRTISSIKSGRTWADIKWPDGSTGVINPQRRQEIIREHIAARRDRSETKEAKIAAAAAKRKPSKKSPKAKRKK